jgi:hypothetical protein
LGYWPTYTLEGYVRKGGEKVRLMKRFDSNWIVFAKNNNGDKFACIDNVRDQSTYQDVERMMYDKVWG